jgi:hypothetical protein
MGGQVEQGAIAPLAFAQGSTINSFEFVRLFLAVHVHLPNEGKGLVRLGRGSRGKPMVFRTSENLYEIYQRDRIAEWSELRTFKE